MKVPFLDLAAGVVPVRSAVEARFSEIIDHTAFVCGKNVAEFEKVFASMHDVAYAVGLSSGTDGNHVAVVSCGVKPGEEVLVPANTFIATAEGVSHAGATPVFVDVDERTFNLDPDQMEFAITGRTRAVCPVHLFGQPAQMDRIIEVAQKHQLMVIEDCAQAHLAAFKGKPVGGWGAVGSWSFYPGKNMGAWGEAGAITTNDVDIFEQIRKFRDHGSAKKYHHDLVGHNYRMSEFQGAVLAEKAKHIEAWTEMRRSNAIRYNERLRELDEVVTPFELERARHVYHLYVIRTRDRDGLQAYLGENGIATGMHYPIPLHLTEAYASLGYRKGQLPIAEKLASEILSLPMYPELTESQIDYVCEHIRNYLTK